MSEPDAVPLPREGEVFFDVRGDARSLRLSWYADSRIAVFSIWQGDRCTGTFRLPFGELARMVQTLQSGPRPRGDSYAHEPRTSLSGAASIPDRGYPDPYSVPSPGSPEFGAPEFVPGPGVPGPGVPGPGFPGPGFPGPGFPGPGFPGPGVPGPGFPGYDAQEPSVPHRAAAGYPGFPDPGAAGPGTPSYRESYSYGDMPPLGDASGYGAGSRYGDASGYDDASGFGGGSSSSGGYGGSPDSGAADGYGSPSGYGAAVRGATRYSDAPSYGAPAYRLPDDSNAAGYPETAGTGPTGYSPADSGPAYPGQQPLPGYGQQDYSDVPGYAAGHYGGIDQSADPAESGRPGHAAIPDHFGSGQAEDAAHWADTAYPEVSPWPDPAQRRGPFEHRPETVGRRQESLEHRPPPSAFSAATAGEWMPAPAVAPDPQRATRDETGTGNNAIGFPSATAQNNPADADREDAVTAYYSSP
jgi:hypothetical protein